MGIGTSDVRLGVSAAMTDTIDQADESGAVPPDDPAGRGEAPEAPAARPGERRRGRTLALVAGLTALVGGLPLAVALGVLHNPRWYPLLDLAQTELRVRDVGGDHRPLVGLAGRLRGYGVSGSHPGPLSFYSLFPFYKLFGGSAWALQAAAASLNVTAIGLAIWIGHRRGGVAGAVGLATALAVLARAYGAGWLTEAWNPYMPMLWWTVFLLAVWSVLCDDLAMLPVAVFAGSFCAQTHIPYAGLIGGMGAFTVAVVAVGLWPHRADAGARRQLLRWGLPSLALLGVLWTPPVVDQLTNDPGNLAIIEENFSNPPDDDEIIGLGEAVQVALGNLDVTTLVRGYQGSEAALAGVSVPGLLLLGLWIAAAVVAVRRGYAVVLRLHMVVAAALVLGLVSVSRILGFLWYYLVLWSWGTMTLTVVAVAWTAALLRRDLAGPQEPAAAIGAAGEPAADASPEPTGPEPTGADRRRVAVPAMAGLGALLLATTASFTYDAAHTEVPAASETDALRHVAPVAIERLASGDLPGGGEDGRYLLRWDEDALAIGSQGYGFLNELERQGFDVGVPEAHSTGSVPHRVRAPGDADAIVNYVIGEANIDRWRADPTAVEVVFHEPRSAADLERYERLRDEVADGLRAEGLDDLVDVLDNKLFLVGIDPRVPAALTDKVAELMDLGLPAAVFVAPG
jgi:hypothetical protein